MSELPSILGAGGREGHCQPLTFFASDIPIGGTTSERQGPWHPMERGSSTCPATCCMILSFLLILLLPWFPYL